MSQSPQYLVHYAGQTLEIDWEGWERIWMAFEAAVKAHKPRWTYVDHLNPHGYTERHLLVVGEGIPLHLVAPLNTVNAPRGLVDFD